jgi:hypothetical protein
MATSWWNGVADFWTTTIGNLWRNARHSGPIDRNSVFTWWIFGLPRHPLLTTLLWTCVWFVSSLIALIECDCDACFVHYSVLNLRSHFPVLCIILCWILRSHWKMVYRICLLYPFVLCFSNFDSCCLLVICFENPILMCWVDIWSFFFRYNGHQKTAPN